MYVIRARKKKICLFPPPSLFFFFILLLGLKKREKPERRDLLCVVGAIHTLPSWLLAIFHLVDHIENTVFDASTYVP